MSNAGFDVAVVGGGLVGTALAYELVTSGARVVLVDRHDPGRATDAGAGILSPESSSVEDASWHALASGAGEHYRTLVPALEADGKRMTGYAVTGLLRVGFREWEDELFATNIALARARNGDDVEAITPEEARRRFPPLGEVRNAWYSARAARVDGRSMTAALLDAARANGLTVIDGTVDGIETAGGLVAGVSVGGVSTACDTVAIAGGAWTPELAARLRVTIPVIPVRGQIVHLCLEGADTSEWPIVSPLLSQYIVPWPGGRVVVGATVEPDAGFDARPTAAGMRQLFSEMLRLAPGLAEATFVEIRAGLRPVSADDAPVLGRLPGWANAFVCTGHGANGLLLGPYSARLVAELISGRTPSMDITPFGPDRFGPKPSGAQRGA
ncbi:MAG: NAD(P)/FAD-dependent oxidoreductase [Acidimicrobiia bacterium]